MRLAPALSVLALASTLAVAGCAPSTPDDGKTQVLAAAYPLQFIAERVGGDAVAQLSVSHRVDPQEHARRFGACQPDLCG